MEFRPISAEKCCSPHVHYAGFIAFARSGAVWEQRSYSLRLTINVAIFLLLFFWSHTAESSDQSINKNWRSIAIKGYDPVAYFTMDKAVEGLSRYEYSWHDARWRFASEEHLDLFRKNPEQYAPRFGGYCAEGMSMGRKASIDPQAWLIIDGELYLNYSLEARQEMAVQPQKTIEAADRVWEKLQHLIKDR